MANESYKEALVSNRNWIKDFNYENGKYLNKCLACDCNFIGHKRRLICYQCADHSEEIQPQSKNDSDEAC